ncbi:MAG: 50S ribosomal protein L13 [bacterium]
MKKNKTIYARKETATHDWFIIDAAGKPLGKVATRAAVYLRGKHKAIFTPHVDTGDFIIVINAGKVRVSGKKDEQKTYFTHSGYPGGMKLLPFKDMIKRDPIKVIQLAVTGMLPKNRLGRQIIKKLKVYAGSEHPHNPKNIKKLEV